MRNAATILKEKNKSIMTVPSDTTIYDALKIMVENKIGSIFVVENGKIVGVWTERDLMRNTLLEGFNPKSAIIKDYMTKKLLSAPEDDSIFNLLDKFVGMRLRHLLIEKNGEYIGLLSAGDVMRASLEDKDRELKDLNAMVSWEYYENWHFKKQ